MRHHRAVTVLVAALICMSYGCKGSGGTQLSGNQTNSASVSLVMMATDAPRPGVSVLSLQVTLTGAQLNPGNAPLLAAPVVVDLARLRTETSLIAVANVPPATYSSVALTFANPSITFKNDSGASIVVGTVTCASGSVCVASLPVTGLTGSINFAGSGIVVSATQPSSIALNLSLPALLSSTFQANFLAGATLAQVTPRQQSGPFVAIEDLAGVITAKDATNNKFTLHTALGNYSIAIASGATGTVFINFPTTACTSPSFACVSTDQIVWVNVNLQPDNTLLATKVYFEDATSTQPEIEGLIVATTGLTPPAQFSMVVLQEIPANTGPAIGSVISVAPQSATFDVDNLGASAATASFSFQGIQDVVVGQQVQVLQGANSTSTQINAARVRLRSTRITARVSNTALPLLTLGPAEALPSFLTATGITQIQVVTLSPPNTGAFSEIGGTASDISQIAIGNTVTVRGQLFKNGSATSGAPVVALVATAIIRQ